MRLLATSAFCLPHVTIIYACCLSVLAVPESPTTSCVKQDGIEMHAASVLLDMPAKDRL